MLTAYASASARSPLMAMKVSSLLVLAELEKLWLPVTIVGSSEKGSTSSTSALRDLDERDPNLLRHNPDANHEYVPRTPARSRSLLRRKLLPKLLPAVGDLT
jgi:hypothetical protein